MINMYHVSQIQLKHVTNLADLRGKENNDKLIELYQKPCDVLFNNISLDLLPTTLHGLLWSRS